MEDCLAVAGLCEAGFGGCTTLHGALMAANGGKRVLRGNAV